MVGKGNQEYAVPFYGKPVPMLIDQILALAGKPGAAAPRGIKKVGDTFIGDVEQVSIKGRPMLLWGKGSPVYDAKGALIAAIEAITVGEPHKAADQEEYLGGISSITLKISGDGIGGAIAGAIGSSTGGYGVYATSRRLFVVQNAELERGEFAGRPVQRIHDGRALRHYGRHPPEDGEGTREARIYTAEKADIAKIESKKPVRSRGS